MAYKDKNKTLEYNARYDKENTKGLYLKFNKKTDADILDFLEDIPNKQGYIKELIRKDKAAR